MKKLITAGATLLCMMPNLSQASGFALIEGNAVGQGNAYAGASAHTEDASTIFFNPAGMTLVDQDEMVFAGHLIIPKSDFSNDGSTSVVGGALTGDEDDGGFNAFVPNFYWVRNLEDGMTFGFGAYTAFGLATKYDDDWVGRYHGVESDLKTVNFNPSLAWEIDDKLSVGGGLNITFADVILSSAIDFGSICVASFNAGTCAGLGSLPQQADGFADLEGDNFGDPGLGFNLGMLYQISEQTRLGVAFRSEIDMEVEGEAEFTVPASSSFVFANNVFVDSGLTAEVTLPASLSVSVAHEVDDITYLADITWTGWSSFEELRVEYDNPDQPDSVTTEDWDDTFRYSFGIDYQYDDKIVLRTGVAYDESPVPSPELRTPRLPGSDRTWISFGVSYLYSDELSMHFGYSHLFIDDAEIENEFESSIPTLAAVLKGEYEASVDILSAQLNWKY